MLWLSHLEMLFSRQGHTVSDNPSSPDVRPLPNQPQDIHSISFANRPETSTQDRLLTIGSQLKTICVLMMAILQRPNGPDAVAGQHLPRTNRGIKMPLCILNPEALVITDANLGTRTSPKTDTSDNGRSKFRARRGLGSVLGRLVAGEDWTREAALKKDAPRLTYR